MITKFLNDIKTALFGKSKDPLDPSVFHSLALTAFFAWVGLGADGLSSSCYGPEEAFLALGEHKYWAVLLAIVMSATVFIISASYSQLIELFPHGGGGYLVASKLLGSYYGLTAGAALIVDYILTISISVASGVDAIFSFLPPYLLKYKLATAFLMIIVLIILNLRGVKESIKILLPIFLVFIITHFTGIFYGLFKHLTDFPELVSKTHTQTVNDVNRFGFFAMLFIFLKAYSLGGGTYTGIEAVSNGMQVLREPRVATGKKTMLYMSISLSFTAGGILLCYLLFKVNPVSGKTLNAVLFDTIFGGWSIGNISAGTFIYLITLISEGALLFVAAQSGFVSGPRVLANMASDSWVPHQFAHLSDQLVIKNGIWIMGLASLGILLMTGGNVRILVVMYSINVFATFTLAQLGMCVHWIRIKDKNAKIFSKLSVNVVGLILTSFILVITTTIKFFEGAWVTILITTGFIIICLAINKHYKGVRQSVAEIDTLLLNVPLTHSEKEIPEKNRLSPTAVFLVSGYNGLGIHSILSAVKLFPKHFKNMLFVSAGVIDSSKFKGAEEIDNLKENVVENLEKYVTIANKFGFYSEYKFSLGTDKTVEIISLCKEVYEEFPNSVFFAGKLIFPEDNFATRFLHNQAAFTVQRLLQYEGIQMVILPIRTFSKVT